MFGLGLVATSVLVAVTSGRQRAVERREASLRTDASVQAAALEEYFIRSSAIVRLLAQNPSFPTYLGSARTGENKLFAAANAALAYVEQLFPGQIGEACFIDAQGHELARVVDRQAAPAAALSSDESRNAFFGATLALNFGQVHQSLPYWSQDTHDWVIANSTLMPSSDGARRAIIHYELTVRSFTSTLSASRSRVRIVTREGAVLVDSDVPRMSNSSNQSLGLPNTVDFRNQLKTANGSLDDATVGSDRLAFRRIDGGPNNLNDWFVVTSAPAAIALTEGLGPLSIAMLLSGVAVLVLSWGSAASYQRTLRNQALTDELTGLPNRTLLRDRLSQAALLAARENSSFAILVLDLDRFKEVNDTLGHHRGDELLRSLSKRLKAIMRESDTLARLGGDEFAILMPKLHGSMAAITVAERVAGALTENFLVAGVPVSVGVSIGIAVYPDHGEDVETVMQHADVAMYRAKQAGLDYALYSSENGFADTQVYYTSSINPGDWRLVPPPEPGTRTELVSIEPVILLSVTTRQRHTDALRVVQPFYDRAWNEGLDALNSHPQPRPGWVYRLISRRTWGYRLARNAYTIFGLAFGTSHYALRGKRFERKVHDAPGHGRS